MQPVEIRRMISEVSRDSEDWSNLNLVFLQTLLS